MMSEYRDFNLVCPECDNRQFISVDVEAVEGSKLEMSCLQCGTMIQVPTQAAKDSSSVPGGPEP